MSIFKENVYNMSVKVDYKNEQCNNVNTECLMR